VVAEGALVVERLLPAPPAAVFAAWTDPARLARWMSPFGRGDAEVDLRVGGSFRIVMRGPEQAIEHTGEYREIDPPRRLVFTWRSPYAGPDPSVVTVECLSDPDDAGKTRLRVVHAHLPPGHVEPHRGGWGAMLEHLATDLADGG
jgi:uncharacterized protein YndB with AHSA1/START domain